jgi:hypothetical protein
VLVAVAAEVEQAVAVVVVAEQAVQLHLGLLY